MRSRHGHGSGSRAGVSLRLVPFFDGTPRDLFQVRATSKNPLHPFRDNPIGVVAKKHGAKTWQHSSGSNPGAGAIQGDSKTAALAAAECFRSYRAWIGF